MKINKIDADGVKLITQWEGLKLKPYLCSAGVPTIGYGSTRYENGTKVKLTDASITKERAIELFKNTISSYERDVDAFCRDDINQNQFNALVSFAYNLGSNALKKSSLLKKVNENPNNPQIASEFRKWVYAGGKIISGLVNRRNAEIEIYFKK